MPKQFYMFERRAFRDELVDSFVRPAANWFLGKESDRFLLPQLSGSNWECALAVEALLDLMSLNAGQEASFRAVVETKAFETMRWVLSQVEFDKATGTCNWDGVTWDTAVCARVLFAAEPVFKPRWSDQEGREISRVREGVTRWLVYSGINWDRDVRYPAGPPDLAQVLNTLVGVSRSHPEMLAAAEKEYGLSKGDRVIDRIARVLLGMEQNAVWELPDGKAELSFWVDCFNTSEVAEGLVAYIELQRSLSNPAATGVAKEARSALYRAMRFIELNQSDGTWGGVADTCGTLYGYMFVTSCLGDIDPQDHVIFKALRWMCDEKQALSDGSFLHTSYVTVFYLKALLEVVKRWRLGGLPGAEVYDVALWSAPGQATAERSRRLELQLQLEDAKRDLRIAVKRHQKLRRLVRFGIAVLLQGAIICGILVLAGVVTADWSSVNFRIVEPDKFWAIVGIGLSLMLGVTPAVIAMGDKSAD